jgi:hypothetical protein
MSSGATSETGEAGLERRPAPRRLGRSALALFAGFVVVVLLSIGTDVTLHAAGVFPALGQPMSDTLFALATSYRTLYAVVGSYCTARLAPNRPMQHALLGGTLGLVLATIGALARGDRAAERLGGRPAGGRIGRTRVLKKPRARSRSRAGTGRS